MQEPADAQETQPQPPAKRRRVGRMLVDSEDDEDGESQPEGDGEEDEGDEAEGEADEGEEAADSDDEVPDYFVKKVHGVRKPDTTNKRPLQFLIEWEGFPDPDAFTWEPVRNLPHNLHLLREFKESWIAAGKRWPATWRIPAAPATDE
mmetsp:Transcript_14349/g.35840  ORF Transcript_14349/g.35840 Transcript_14349/m.35840 type:complete len:148 (+) Transcript_14349:55-498(+)